MTVADLEPESLPRYSSGAFMNILDRDVAGWQRRVNFLRSLDGMSHVEIWLEEVALSPGERAELRKMLGEWRIVIHAPHMQLSMVSHHDMVRGAAADVYRRTMGLAEELGAQMVTFHGGSRPFFLDEELAMDQIVAMFTSLSAGSRVVAALKNMPIKGRRLAVYPASLSDLRHIMGRMPELKVTLDVGHCVQNRDNWIAFLRRHAERIVNIHLHDAHPEGQGQLRLGTGALDPFALARLLRAVGYAGFLSLDTVGQKDTTFSWQLWRRAQAEAAQETTATLNANAIRNPHDPENPESPESEES